MVGKKIPGLMTLKEACEILSVHPNTLRNWDRKGVLIAVRIGLKRSRRYKKKDIENLISQKH